MLNRSVLSRQLLLARVDLPVVDAVERLLGLNAQSPNLPYLALWTRLSRFALADLTASITDRVLVRSVLMRATQHVVTVADFRLLRPAVAPLLSRARRNAFGRRTEGVDLDALVVAARELLADGAVLTRPELGRELAKRFPVKETGALGWSVQYLEPVVHPAPSGTWNVYGATPFASAEWTGVGALADLSELVRRYLAAFGPATVADARAWSGVSGLRDVFAELRPSLRVYQDESGRELFDDPAATLPPADLPAPVRFLPEFDAPLLAYADRTRMMTDEVRARVCVGSGVAATVLVDGTVAATWSIDDDDRTARLTVTPFRRLSTVDIAEVEEEGARLLAFAAPERDHDIRTMP
ncbi:winged helix DNA-binding domain-containing protein [Actinophytocola sediminis]